MKIFDQWQDKLNFVDDNNVFVGYDYQSDCCEAFGYYFKESIDGDRVDRDEIDFDGWNFDTSYCERAEEKYEEYEVTFRLTNGEDEMFLVLYNYHNGYYSHGFEMKADDEVIHDGVI
jgi:hypothetical protein